MKTNPARSRPNRVLCALICVPTSVAFGQAVVAPATVTATPSAAADKTDAVVLTPFEVTANSDVGYESSTAMSGTRTNESLANLPNSISVMNTEFMTDLGITDFFQAAEFAVGADNIYNDNMQVGAPVGSRSGNQINFRGLPSVRQLKDGFPTYTPQDNYNTERIEISRGPGGIAYGDTDATGVINLTSKRGQFRTETEVGSRLDDRGSRRFTLDFSRVLLGKTLAARVNLIDSNLEGWHENTNREFRAGAAALRYQPFKTGRTVIDATFEQGVMVTHLSHTALNNQMAAYVRGTGTIARDANPNLTGVQTNGVGTARLAGPATATADVHAWTMIGGQFYNLQTMGTTDPFPVYRITTVTQGAAATSATDPQNPRRIPIVPIPVSLFPLDQDWAGPDAKVDYGFSVANFSVQHKAARNLDLWLAYNRQDETTAQSLTRNGNIAGANVRAVFLDVNPRLPDPAFPSDPTRTIANPNYEQFLLLGTITRRHEKHAIESMRLIGVYSAEFWKTSHRFIFSVNHRDEIYRIQNFNWGLTKEEITRRGYSGVSARLASNVVTPWYYFKDGNGEKLKIPRAPGVLDYFINGAAGLQYFDQSLGTAVFQHLGTFFKGRLRTSIGLSRDHWQQAGNLPTRSFGDYQEFRFVDAAGNPLANDADKIPTLPLADTWKTNTSYGGVFNLTDWLGVTASYQESALFTDNVGTDLSGAARAPTQGSGVDLGLRFSLLKNRLHATVVYYHNTSGNNRTSISTALRTEVNAALDLGLGAAGSPDRIVGLDDSNDRDTKGLELELTANLTRNWTARLGYSDTQNRRASSLPQFRAKVAAAEAHLKAMGRSAAEIDATLDASHDLIAAQSADDVQPKQYRGTFVTRYDFREGRLRGFSAGGSLRWAHGRLRDPGGLTISGQLVLSERLNADEFVVSPFFKYTAKFGAVRWTGQLNIDNAFNNVTNQGRIERYPRYTDPRLITFTNSFRF